MKEMQVCSKAVYDILVAFNNLGSLEEQEEVLDVIYDALSGKVLREVLASRLDKERSATILDLKRQVIDMETENNDLKIKLKFKEQKIKNILSVVESDSRKKLRNANNGLLIIINNLKHYLGDSWQTIFPGGCGNVDEFLRKVDTKFIMNQDTWSRYDDVDNVRSQSDGSIEGTEDLYF